MVVSHWLFPLIFRHSIPQIFRNVVPYWLFLQICRNTVYFLESCIVAVWCTADIENLVQIISLTLISHPHYRTSQGWLSVVHHHWYLIFWFSSLKQVWQTEGSGGWHSRERVVSNLLAIKAGLRPPRATVRSCLTRWRSSGRDSVLEQLPDHQVTKQQTKKRLWNNTNKVSTLRL